MDPSTATLRHVSTSTKTLARRLLLIGENRLELLAVEMEEGRERLMKACLLALGIAAFGMLAGGTFTAAIVLSVHAVSPVWALLTLTVIYALTGILLYRKLSLALVERHLLVASLEQLRKDRVSLEQLLQ